jgi:polyhydroxyalkanoate synthesis regulator phasin
MAKSTQTRAEAVRAAVDQTVQAAADQAHAGRHRAQDLLDELTQTAGRVREALDDLRPSTTEDIRELRREVRALERRVKALEERGPGRAGETRRSSKPKRATTVQRAAQTKRAAEATRAVQTKHAAQVKKSAPSARSSRGKSTRA